LAISPPDIRDCAIPTPPVMDCARTRIYGAPRGRPGRNSVPILAIAIHCVGDNYDGYMAKACSSDGRLASEHTSFHYVLDSETPRLTQLVPESDLAWAFQSYPGNFPITQPVQPTECPPPCPAPVCPTAPVPIPASQAYPGWPVLAALFPTTSADFYTINIGLTVPDRATQILDGADVCCLGSYGLSEESYAKLVRLVNWIAYRYSIPFDDQHIAFHDQITSFVMGCEECKCAPTTCFLCDVSSYCERCINEGDPTFMQITTGLHWIYGESTGGCKVKMRVSDFLAQFDIAVNP
jgi:hypothetical protein